MTSQTAPADGLSLLFQAGDLESNNKFELHRKRREHLGLIVITTFEREPSVTLFSKSINRTGLNLIDALRSGLLELVEPGKDNVIVLPAAPSPQPFSLNIPPKPSPQHRQASAGVSADTTHAAWKEILQPGLTYGLRLSNNNGEVFACYSDDFDGQPGNVPSSQSLPIHREGGTYYFTVHDDSAPPRIFARLEMPRLAHLTGPIPFTFVIEYTTDSLEPFVVDKSRSPLSVFDEDLKCLENLIDCRHNITGKEVRWCAAFGCWDSDPHPKFPNDDDFIELSVNKPWRFECTPENLDNEDEYVRSMEGLEAGQTYKTRIAERALGAFNLWQYGTKEKLSEGTQEEKIRRWEVDMEKLGVVSVERIGKDVEFETIA